MRTTINIDTDMLLEAGELIGSSEKTAIVRESLKALIERESAKRLAALGGSEPMLKVAERRSSYNS